MFAHLIALLELYIGLKKVSVTILLIYRLSRVLFVTIFHAYKLLLTSK